MEAKQIISLDKFVSNAHKLVEDIRIAQSALILTQDDSPVAVVQDIQQYQKLLKAVYMLKLMAQGEKDIREGKERDQADVFEKMNHLLESKIG